MLFEILNLNSNVAEKHIQTVIDLRWEIVSLMWIEIYVLSLDVRTFSLIWFLGGDCCSSDFETPELQYAGVNGPSQ